MADLPCSIPKLKPQRCEAPATWMVRCEGGVRLGTGIQIPASWEFACDTHAQEWREIHDPLPPEHVRPLTEADKAYLCPRCREASTEGVAEVCPRCEFEQRERRQSSSPQAFLYGGGPTPLQAAEKELARIQYRLVESERRRASAESMVEHWKKDGLEAARRLTDALVQILVRAGFKGLVEKIAECQGHVDPRVLLSIVQDYLDGGEGSWCITCMNWHDPIIPTCVPDFGEPSRLTYAMRMLTVVGGHVMMDKHLGRGKEPCTCDESYDADCLRCSPLLKALPAARHAAQVLESIVEARKRDDWDYERQPGGYDDEDDDQYGGLI